MDGPGDSIEKKTLHGVTYDFGNFQLPLSLSYMWL